jgi:hypothetical protein
MARARSGDDRRSRQGTLRFAPLQGPRPVTLTPKPVGVESESSDSDRTRTGSGPGPDPDPGPRSDRARRTGPGTGPGADRASALAGRPLLAATLRLVGARRKTAESASKVQAAIMVGS